MRIKSERDFWSGLLFVVIGVVIFIVVILLVGIIYVAASSGFDQNVNF